MEAAEAAPVATLDRSAYAGKIVTLRVGTDLWAAAVAVAPGEWRQVPGEYASEADAIRAASVVLPYPVAV